MLFVFRIRSGGSECHLDNTRKANYFTLTGNGGDAWVMTQRNRKWGGGRERREISEGIFSFSLSLAPFFLFLNNTKGYGSSRMILPHPRL